MGGVHSRNDVHAKESGNDGEQPGQHEATAECGDGVSCKGGQRFPSVISFGTRSQFMPFAWGLLAGDCAAL